MNRTTALSFVRWIHTISYVAMVAAIAVLLYTAITGHAGICLWISLGLLAAETAVFVGNGMKCPLTALAVRYGAEKGYAFDTLLPERFTRHTFHVFGTLMILGLMLMVLRWTDVLH